MARQPLLMRSKARFIELYRKYEQRQARIQQARADLGADAFLSGHDGWIFHRGTSRHDHHD